MDSSGWSVGDHGVHSATAEDDFQQYLDMTNMNNLADGIDYNFQGFQAPAGPHMLQVTGREQLDTPMTGSDAPMLLSPAMPAMHSQVSTITTTGGAYQSIPTTMMPPPTPSETIVNSIDAQIHFLQQQKMQAQQRQMEEHAAYFARQQQSRMIPPTPQSLDMVPSASPFYSQRNGPESQQQHQQQHPHPHRTPHQQQAVDYRYQRAKDQSDVCSSPYPGSGNRFTDGAQMSFTPLVSPAVTPLDTNFPVESQFTVPGAYFSPLTSPALHAQTDPLAMFEQRHGPVTTSSPIEMDLDGAGVTMPIGTPGDLAKKMRKNAAKARAKAGVKQSPISKPLRKRLVTTPSLNSQALSDLMESAEQNQDYQPLPTSMMHNSSSSTTTGPTDSEDGSISPEALNDTTPIETEMPPPPLPKSRSARPSPYIAPQTTGSAPSIALQPPRPGVASPATPASLMKLSSPSTHTTVAGASRTDNPEAVDTEHIELFELPESVSNVTAPPTETNNTPTPKQPPQDAGPSKTPSLAPLPSPSLGPTSVRPSGTASATASPQLGPGPGYGAKRTPQLLPRNSKKRGSVSSIPVSPALRPKISISPNIKPLLPGGADLEETASQLLASKSNYQRILEGNTVPGVSYPSELSTNLTSKRTSHKIAEQGRRNRINSALQEIATLLPKQPKDSEGEGSGDNKSKEKEKEKERERNGGAPNSKASTVEMAIEYIKQLQQQVAEANKRAEEAEKKLAETGRS
ncbi:helix-loop-helix DNA-binding domain-containing protein [Triangularia verruculosa]|uniref:Helix-loop-helix DNA-binding domain-containing protein n=1 Tax=Triangularia verruculosa TaxID=2587418 RepID=A0AAN6XCG3_9PEZI|nr:helix-loop-helix DNA-binding domain-containing protein [Triangularia verruculosa]